MDFTVGCNFAPPHPVRCPDISMIYSTCMCVLIINAMFINRQNVQNIFLLICIEYTFLIIYFKAHVQYTLPFQCQNNVVLLNITYIFHMFGIFWHTVYYVCARLAQLVRSLTANQKVPGSTPGLVKV